MNYAYKIFDDHKGHFNLARRRFDGKYHKIKEYNSQQAAQTDLDHLKAAISTGIWLSGS